MFAPPFAAATVSARAQRSGLAGQPKIAVSAIPLQSEVDGIQPPSASERHHASSAMVDAGISLE
jgi:hypothetical protein